MASKRATLFDDAPAIPDMVRDEAIIVPPGETNYEMCLDDQTIEALAKGICPEDLAQRAHKMLEWKRRCYRVQAARSFDAVTQGS